MAGVTAPNASYYLKNRVFGTDAPGVYTPASTTAGPRQAPTGTETYGGSTVVTPPGPNEFARIARNNGISGSYTDPTTGVSWNTSGASPYSADQAGQDYATLEARLGSTGARYTPQAPPPPVAPSPYTDSSAADAAAFAKAKDRVGQLGSGALASLRASTVGSGMRGALARGTTNIIQGNEGQLGEVIRDQAIQQAQRNAAVADRNYQGEITQRGQDIGYTESERNRQQEAANQQRAQISALMALLRRSSAAA